MRVFLWCSCALLVRNENTCCHRCGRRDLLSNIISKVHSKLVIKVMKRCHGCCVTWPPLIGCWKSDDILFGLSCVKVSKNKHLWLCWVRDHKVIDEHSYQIHSWSDSVVTGASIVAFVYGWPFVAKFNNVYLYATIYIDSTSTQDIFIQRLYWLNFNTGYFHSTTIFIQFQQGLFLCKTNIYPTSTPKVMFYETNI